MKKNLWFFVHVGFRVLTVFLKIPTKSHFLVEKSHFLTLYRWQA
jgi:hypothetical protein